MRDKRRSVLLFDWDGTLYDSAVTGFAAFRLTFKELGVSSFTEEFYETHYSPNWYSMYEALGLPREQWAGADRLWLEHYRHQPVSMIPGAYDALQAVVGDGYRVGLVTSGTHSRIVREIDHLGLNGVFEVVICNEDVVKKKPHPEGIEKAMVRLNISAESCSYIGDAPEDIQMGKRASVFTVAVRSAYPTSKHLAATEPDLLIESIGELLLHF